MKKQGGIAALPFFGLPVVIVLLALPGLSADRPVRSYFSADLVMATTLDDIDHSPRTSSGTLYYDSTLAGVRFEGRTTSGNPEGTLPSLYTTITHNKLVCGPIAVCAR